MKPYPSYKPSGVPWLGEVPAHWSIEKLKLFVRFVGGGTPSKDNDEYWGGDIPWVSPKDMKRPRIDDTEDKITEDAVGSSACTMIASGAVLVVVRSGILQHTIPIAINDVPVAVNQDMKALIPDERVQSSFLAYQIQGCQRELREDWVKQGATVESVEQQRMADSRFTIPPPDEQEAIAAYLDRETARIDMLLAEKGRLIETLREYRQATISEVVTQGLDPATPKKPSGVPWLGEIPAHWGLKRLKFHVEQVGEKTSEPLAGVAYIGLEHIESGTGKFIPSMDGTQTESESTVSHFRVGDVLFGKLRPYLAKAVIAYGDGVCTTELLVLRPHSMDSGYLLRCLLLDGFIKTVDASTFGAKMPRADWTFISNLLLPEPPVAEQQAIAAYLDRETARIDRLVDHVQDEIKLLQELRAATITDAVTGKIQVG